MFSQSELFGWFDGTEATGRLINCKVCGCVVQYDHLQMNLHQTFHNRLYQDVEH